MLLNSKADVSVGVVTLVFRAYLVDQPMDHLAGTLKRGGVKDLLAFFPPNRRDAKTLEDHFKKEGLIPVAEWWAKKQYAVVKEEIVRDLREMGENEDSSDQVSQIASLCIVLTPNASSCRLLQRSRVGKRLCLSPRLNSCSASGKD